MSKESLGDFSRLPFRKRIELTKESIQKDLEASDYLFPKNVNINTKYILEIIEQAERVEDLERENKLLKFIAEENKIAYKQRMKQNKRYREALEEISKPIYGVTYADMFAVKQIARKALEGDLE